MQKFITYLLSLATVVVLSVALSSCKDDEPPVPPKLSFSVATMSVKESDGTITFDVVLDKPTPKDIVIEYSVGGTAREMTQVTSQEAYDYELVTDDFGEIEIRKGESSATMEINLFSDFGVENPETIEIQFEEVTDGIELTRDDEIKITINQEDGIIVALDWGINPGESYTDVDMDLFLWVPDAGQLVISDVASARSTVTPPEAFFLPTAIMDDGTYGVSCNYYSGTKTPMNFRLRYFTLINSTQAVVATKTATYTTANVNAWDQTKVAPLLSATFVKSGTSFSSFSDITVPASGSRMGATGKVPPTVKRTK